MNEPTQDLGYAHEAERAVIALALLRPEGFALAAALRPGHFHLEAHRILWGALNRMATAEAKPITLRGLKETLEDSGQLDAAGGMAYLGALDLDLRRTDERAMRAYVRILLESPRGSDPRP